jgi:hypothetical protein
VAAARSRHRRGRRRHGQHVQPPHHVDELRPGRLVSARARRRSRARRGRGSDRWRGRTPTFRARHRGCRGRRAEKIRGLAGSTGHRPSRIAASEPATNERVPSSCSASCSEVAAAVQLRSQPSPSTTLHGTPAVLMPLPHASIAAETRRRSASSAAASARLLAEWA